jgi:glycosyltransferase involved in cell wall biosynthesis
VQIGIPARNEAENIGAVLEVLRRVPNGRITVVDNASTDETGAVARAAGAIVLQEGRIGRGFALVAALRSCDAGQVFLCDADVRGLEPAMVQELCRLARDRQAPVARLSIGREPEAAPVTILVGRPLLAALGYRKLNEPIGGMMVVDRDFVLRQHLPGGWGFDPALTIAALSLREEIPELPVTGVSHRAKPLGAYAQMAEEVVLALLRAQGMVDWTHEDCVACHPQGRIDAPMVPSRDSGGSV